MGDTHDGKAFGTLFYQKSLDLGESRESSHGMSISETLVNEDVGCGVWEELRVERALQHTCIRQQRDPEIMGVGYSLDGR